MTLNTPVGAAVKEIESMSSDQSDLKNTTALWNKNKRTFANKVYRDKRLD